VIKIYYFSGTGNTLWSAKKIAEQCGEKYELINIGAESKKDEIVLEADAVLILFPSYAYGAPLIVNSFVKRAVFKTPYLALFVTYGTSPAGTLGNLYSVIKRKGVKAVYSGKIPAVENYIPMFGSPKPGTIDKRVGLQKESTKEAALIVKERRINSIGTFRPISKFVWVLFTAGIKIFYKWYRVGKDCNGCGICEKVCPVSAITMRNKRPVHSNKCEHCQGCINWCPVSAINFGFMSPKTKRYHHPEIGITDISASDK